MDIEVCDWRGEEEGWCGGVVYVLAAATVRMGSVHPSMLRQFSVEIKCPVLCFMVDLDSIS